MESKQDLPVIAFSSAADWSAWLAEHHQESRGVWLKLAKRDSGVASVNYSDALDVALCHGWIDGQKGALDAQFWLQRFTPRGPRSRWSKVNCRRVEALLAQSRMTAAGHKQVDKARADGRWDAAYAGQRSAPVPEDLQRALEANPKALSFFATLNGANRYAILYRVEEAKRPETRARRIDKFVTMLAQQQTLYPWAGTTTASQRAPDPPSL